MKRLADKNGRTLNSIPDTFETINDLTFLKIGNRLVQGSHEWEQILLKGRECGGVESALKLFNAIESPYQLYAYAIKHVRTLTPIAVYV